jgi:LPS-assembly protein
MKNNIFYIFILIFSFVSFNLSTQELEINSSKIKYDDLKKTTIFEGNVNSTDEKGNKLFSKFAKYNKVNKLFETQGETKIITSSGFEALGADVTLDNNKQIIYSDKKTRIKDKDGNKIFVDMFSYSILTNIFFSKGNIKVLDINENIYNFSEIYIDENKRKIIGSDVKAFLNQEQLKVDKDNEPKFFANTMSLSNDIRTFEKGVFTYCKNRENDKCPPWVLQSKKIKHDVAKKTIYYDNVVLKIYDFPIFFSPKFSHPDPTVKRKSGLLAPRFSSSAKLGTGFAIPYFWNIGDDKDLTLTPKLYLNENPLLLAEYRKDFKKSFLTVDTSYTEGYKKKNSKKSKGGRSHFFSNFNMSLIDEDEKYSNLEINLQKVSNDTFFKAYDIETSLVEANQQILENMIDLSYQDKDFYLGLAPSIFEDTKKNGHSKYEYLLPLTIEKKLMTSEKYGFLDLGTDLRIRNFDTNKQSNILVNNFNWGSKKWLNKLGINSSFEGLVKTVNYEAKNTKDYKNNRDISEVNSVIGYFADLGLYKNDFINKNLYTLTPKFLLRYAPGHMRDLDNTTKLNYGNLFNLNKIEQFDAIETGLSSSIGFEYKKNRLKEENIIGDEIYSFSAGQVITAEENPDIPSTSSLDQKFSDIVGESKYNINNNINLSYNFSLDQNYKTFNYNEIGTDIDFNKVKFNVSYLEEKNHIGNQEFVKSGIDFTLNNSSKISLTSKRNLLTSSSEFYNLSYNYINDCLTAGIAYRRDFYTDKDVEKASSLMFTISIIPFAQNNIPTSSK